VAPDSAGMGMGMSDDTFVTIARVVKTQGRRGEVAAALLTDFPERFHTRRRLFAFGESTAQRRELQLENHWYHKGMVVLKFVGVDSISDAEALVGCEIQVPRSERAELGADEFYVSDLAGCVVTDSGREIGRVKDVQFSGGEAPLLVIESERELLVPLPPPTLRRSTSSAGR